MEKTIEGGVSTLENNQIAENPITVSPEGNLSQQKVPEIRKEKSSEIKREIHELKEEIEKIKLANSKVEDGKLRGIAKEVIADDVSAAGLSIEEREDKIRELQSKRPGFTQGLKKVFHILFPF